MDLKVTSLIKKNSIRSGDILMEFSNLDQKLTIHTKQDRIVIGGKNAVNDSTRPYGLEGTDVEELENVP